MTTKRLPGNTMQAREKLQEAEWSEAMSERERRRVVNSAQALGAVRATIAVANTLNRGGFQRLHQFVEDEEYKDIGYPNVVEFFNSADAPMTKNQYYDRLKAFEREGGEVFELLNAMKIPLRDRKLLEAGEIRIDGQEVILGHEDREERVSINDRLAIKTLIATLAEKQQKTEQRVAALDKKLQQGQKEFDQQKRELDQLRRSGGVHIDGTPHGQALLTLIGSYAKLRDEVLAYADSIEPGSEGDAEFHRFHKQTIETIGNCYVELSDAFGITGGMEISDDELANVDAADLLEN